MRRYSVVYAAVWARAPSRWAREGAKRETAAVISRERATITATVWLKRAEALSRWPWPRAKAQRVEVPMERRMAMPDRRLTKGRARFTLAKASSPTPLATKIPSTKV